MIESENSQYYMVIEQFKENAMEDVYKRFSLRGRMLPDGLNYVDSWLDRENQRCFQVMQTQNPSLFDEWTQHWNDLVDFQIVAVEKTKQ